MLLTALLVTFILRYYSLVRSQEQATYSKRRRLPLYQSEDINIKRQNTRDIMQVAHILELY